MFSHHHATRDYVSFEQLLGRFARVSFYHFFQSSFGMAVAVRSEAVSILRYDISSGMASAVCGPLLGMQMEAIWHTSIVVFGKEYFFDGGIGIVSMTPRTTPFGTPLREEFLGSTTKSLTEFEAWNNTMRDGRFGPRGYNIIENNCNHYTHEAAVFLTGLGVPDDVINMIPNMVESPFGTLLAPLAENLLPMLQGLAGYDGGGSLASAIPTAMPQRDQRARPGPSHAGHHRSHRRAAAAAAGSDSAPRVEEVASDSDGDDDGSECDVEDVVISEQPRSSFAERLRECLQRCCDLDAGATKQEQGISLAVQCNRLRAVCALIAAVAASAFCDQQVVDVGDVFSSSDTSANDDNAWWALLAVLGFGRSTSAQGPRAVFTKAILFARADMEIAHNEVASALEDAEVNCAVFHSSDAGGDNTSCDNDAPSAEVRAPPPMPHSDATSPRGVVGQRFVFGVPPGCSPFRTLEELLAWDGSFDHVPVAATTAERIRFRKDTMDANNAQPCRAAVIHDFKGGYVPEEAYWDGTVASTPYAFRHWSRVDVFIYFSHSFVAVPPQQWILAAHRHGVRCLGTIFVAGESKIWESILESDETAAHVAAKLALVADAFGFDGYMFDVQGADGLGASLALPATVRVAAFTRFLGALRAGLHQEKSHPNVSRSSPPPRRVLLLYDTLNGSGKRQPQGGVTEENRLFVDACDGFIADYKQKPTPNRDGAHNRFRYACLDVWGRGWAQGCGFLDQDVAQLAANLRWTPALFAPAWSLEEARSAVGSDSFGVRDDALWSAVAAGGSAVHRPSWQFTVESLPFWTTFNAEGRIAIAVVGGRAVTGSSQFNLLHVDYDGERELNWTIGDSLPARVTIASRLDKSAAFPPTGSPAGLAIVATSSNRGVGSALSFPLCSIRLDSAMASVARGSEPHGLVAIQWTIRGSCSASEAPPVVSPSVLLVASNQEEPGTCPIVLSCRKCLETVHGGNSASCGFSAWRTQRFVVEVPRSASGGAIHVGLQWSGDNSVLHIGQISVTRCAARPDTASATPDVQRSFVFGVDPTSLLTTYSLSFLGGNSAASRAVVVTYATRQGSEQSTAVRFCNVLFDGYLVGRALAGRLTLTALAVDGVSDEDVATRLGIQAVDDWGAHGSVRTFC